MLPNRSYASTGRLPTRLGVQLKAGSHQGRKAGGCSRVSFCSDLALLMEVRQNTGCSSLTARREQDFYRPEYKALLTVKVHPTTASLADFAKLCPMTPQLIPLLKRRNNVATL